MSKMLDMRFAPAWKNKYVARIIRNGYPDKVHIILDERMTNIQTVDVVSRLIACGVDVEKIQNLVVHPIPIVKLFGYALGIGLNIDGLFTRNYDRTTLEYIIRAMKKGLDVSDIAQLGPEYPDYIIRYCVILVMIGSPYQDILENYMKLDNDQQYWENVFVEHISKIVKHTLSELEGYDQDIPNSMVIAGDPYIIESLIEDDKDLFKIFVNLLRFTFYEKYDIAYYIHKASKYKNFKSYIPTICAMIELGFDSSYMVFYINLPHLVKHNVQFSDIYEEGDTAAVIKYKIEKRAKLMKYLNIDF